MYHSATTRDNEVILYTGRNSESFNECVQDVWNFHTETGLYSEEDEKQMLQFTIKDKYEHVITTFDIIFIMHTKLYEDSDEN
jgi:hypothetical protein